MRIKKLHLQNFRGFENLEMTFPETSNLVVLIGKNGSGKTTVLDAVAHHLKQIATWLMTKDKIDFSKTIIPMNNIMKGKLIFDTLFGLDMEFIYNKAGLNKNVNITSWEVLEKNKIDNRNIIEFIKYFRDSSIFINENTELNNVPILIYYSLNKNEKESNNIIQESLRTFIPRSLCYENAFSANVNNYNDFLEWYKDNEDLENRVRLDRDNNFRIRELEDLRKALSIFATAISNLDVSNLRIRQYKKDGVNVNFEKNTTTYYLSLLKDKIEFNFSELSSGERAIILLVVDIARRLSIANDGNALNGSGIVLIDEIDQHLHPEWQRNILPALAKTFPNVQFIVTTHSPQVLSSLPKESVFILKDGKAFTNGLHTKGRDSNSLLQEAFDIPKHEKALADKLNAFYGFLNTKNKAEAEKILEELTELWGDNDVEIVRANLYFQDLLDEISE
jgi:predicted ATP-binding protein involved in virulence